MICHNAIATDKPRIQRITAMRQQGLDLAWQRVFDYPQTSHVKFNHAPHIPQGSSAPPATARLPSRRSPSATST